MHKQLIAALMKAGVIEADATLGEAKAALKAWAQANAVTLPENLNDAAAIQPILDKFSAADAPASDVAPDPPANPQPPASPVAANGHVAYRDMVAMVRTANLSADDQVELIAELAEDNLSVSQILDAINTRAQQNNSPTGATDSDPRVTEAAQDKFESAARDAILLGTMQGQIPDRIFDYRTGDYADWSPNRRQYGLSSPLNIARQCLVQGGFSASQVFGLAPMQIAKLVMGADPRQLGLGGMLAADGPSYNVSGMFANILLDARNVALRRSYDDTRVTFDQWMGRGADIPDFKTVHRIIAGELNDPAAIPEDGEFEETTLSDGKESYKLTVWGRMMSRSWQLIVNDQLGAFTEVESKMGASMRRKLNRISYQVLKDNAALSDTGNLFNATALSTTGGHNNQTTGTLTTSADYVGAWNTMQQKLAEQKGLDDDSGTLNLMARHVVYPPALRGIIRQTLGSPSVAINTAGNENTINIWQQGLDPVEEAELGSTTTGGSDTAFYLATDPGQVDTVEYAYLQGLPAPVVEQDMAFDRLAVRSRIYFAFGVKALDFRGLQKHTGA